MSESPEETQAWRKHLRECREANDTITEVME